MVSDSIEKKVVVIIGITSDIGHALATRYSSDNYIIIGTYRSTDQLEELKKLPNCYLFYCDLNDIRSIHEFIDGYKNLALFWNILISCPSNPLPLKAFFKCDFDEWSNSIHTNAIEQMRILHAIYSFRDLKEVVDVVFFAAGGINNSVKNFSALTISKIMLIKMCEFLDAENIDLNIFSIGPGWTYTKTHTLILENVDHSDEKYQKTLEFMKKGEGTSMDDIFGCIRWLCEQGKKVASGRNFSVVNDNWKGSCSKFLASELLSDVDMYKLRRHKNHFNEQLE